MAISESALLYPITLWIVVTCYLFTIRNYYLQSLCEYV